VKPTRIAAACLWFLCLALPGFANEPAKPEFPEVPGLEIFGFTTPTDTGNPGELGLALEWTGRVDKGGGAYSANTLKTELSYGIAEDWSAAVALFTSYHKIEGAPGLADLHQNAFDGFSLELTHRLLRRSVGNPFAVSLSFEPRYARIDPVSGGRTDAFAFEAKLFVDAVVVPGLLYAGFNANFAPALARSDAPDAEWQYGSGASLSGALAVELAPWLFIGAELRWITLFTGFLPERNVSSALLGGPTMLIKVNDNVAFNFAWTPQLAGHSVGDPGGLDLRNFEYHHFRVKVVVVF
jgi:hypothetical protein